MDNSVDIMAWVERLGGWGVLLLLGKWGLQRMDKALDQFGILANDFRAAVNQFKDFEAEERRQHALLERKLGDIKTILDNKERQSA